MSADPDLVRALAGLPGARHRRAGDGAAPAEHPTVAVVLAGGLVRGGERFCPGEVVGLGLVTTPDAEPGPDATDGDAAWLEVPAGAVRALPPENPARGALGSLALARVARLERLLADARAAEAAAVRRLAFDPGTGAHSRAWLDDALPRLLGRVSADRPLSLVLFDVDGFKGINDRAGHPAGDRALAGVVATLHARLRPTDPVARYGGDELAALLPGAGLAAAAAAAERVRAAVAGASFTTSDGAPLPPITVSCGVASALPGEPAERLVARADRALYRAKAGGRNRVSTADGEPE